LTVGAPHPLQIACAQALAFPESYYVQLKQDYQRKRDMITKSLERIGFVCVKPAGAYYVWCDYTELDPNPDDVRFANNLVKKYGVAGVPGSSFFGKSSSSGKGRIRFTFTKKMETLEKAASRLESSISTKVRTSSSSSS
jgi:aspartate/methionine/tyrosine aminotransferase